MIDLDRAVLTRRELLQGALGAFGALSFPEALLALAPDPRYPARPHLQRALQAERWIRGARLPTSAGVAWPADPRDPASVQRNLYSGTPGVVLFLVELHRATGDPAYLDEARAGADELIASLPAPDAEADAGLYTGLAGIAFVLDEVHRASREPAYADAAGRVARRLGAAARPVGAGVEWSDSADIISGSAGIGLYLLRRHAEHGEPEALAAATRAGLRLVERGQPAGVGLRWGISPSVPNLYPNFSHGTAGVGYFLATLHQATGDARFLTAALRGAEYLLSVADVHDGGCRVFHHEPGGEDLYYLSWCHGPPGTARLFHRLGEATGEPRWSGLVHACARAVLASGVPEERTPGFWNNVSQCCGDAGVAEFFLSLHRLAPRPEYIGMVRRCADDVLRRATQEADTLRWVQAEHRVRPELLVAQTGLMQGAAGIGMLFLRMDAFENGRVPAVRLPDNPFV